MKRGLLAGGLLAGAGLGIAKLADPSEGADQPSLPAGASRAPGGHPRSEQPNILVVIVDQLRFPQWVGASEGAGLAPSLPPNLARLAAEGISFEGHYTASNDCTPARSTLLTGLYTHQTGCMITGGSTLDPGFPTWGTMLREQGYRTRWYGKWHLTHHDNRWNERRGSRALERYGFAGGTFPSPDGAPGQGWREDPRIVRQFEHWLAQEHGAAPWCTTVSLVNPHDIAWWYRWSERVPAEASARPVAEQLPPNFETPELLEARSKPLLQRSLQQTAAESFGPVPFTGPEAPGRWKQFLDLYVKLQLEADRNVAQILAALYRRPELAANTVILFTSDHGEYGGSHGLRGKGAGVYEEAIRVPLIVKDPRGKLIPTAGQGRSQLSSSVDVAPLLLTIASGSDDWRREPQYSHLAKRADLAALLADPTAAGRSYVLHATDEAVTEFAVGAYAAEAARHVVAIRTPSAKYATYSNWSGETIEPIAAGQESELYDYSTGSGQLELHNSAGQSELEQPLQSALGKAFREELRASLPAALGEAQDGGFEDYRVTARRAAENAAAARERRAQRELEGLPGGTGAVAGPDPSSDETRVAQLTGRARRRRR